MSTTKILIAIIICLFINKIYSQEYLDESCQWNIKDIAYSDLYYFNTNYKDYIDGDTIIENLSYFKVYREGISIAGLGLIDTMFVYEIDEYKGALREENRKWYWVNKDSINTKVLYDFNKVAGDSLDYFNNGIKHKLILIDSIYHGGGYKKVYELEGTVIVNLIEGVGWNTRLLDPILGPDSFSYLQCFNKNDESLNPDLTTIELAINMTLEDLDECGIVSKIDSEMLPDQHVEIYPNPFIEELVIDTRINVEEIVIFNSLGKAIYNETWKGNKIEVKGLANGVYYLLLKAKGRTSIHKIIKARNIMN